MTSSETMSNIVYVVTYNELPGMYKIGVASNLKARLAALACGVPYNPVIVCVVRSKDAVGLEKALHAKFNSQRINREWFRLDDNDINYISNLDIDANAEFIVPKKTQDVVVHESSHSVSSTMSQGFPTLKRILIAAFQIPSLEEVASDGVLPISGIMSAIEKSITSASTADCIDLLAELVNP